ncbi:AN1-type zinc finger protein 6-like isoform X1 [Paramormyrops kingsleyae]|uniref:AN1-type zinc finger protein 6 n=2 Tax=Paramormyrops kingsleyae TaxID=1676925 RepID=A0A3B3Q991_9TELE
MWDMAQETNQTQGPMLCTTGCGFYGNPRTNGMCSVCYKDYLQRQNSSGRVSPSASSGVSALGESLATPRTDSGVLVLAPASPSATATLETSSSQNLLSQASVTHSEEDDSTGDKARPKTDHLQASVPENTERGSAEGQEPSPDRPKQKRNRCSMCRKKVGLTGFDCRCGNMFCGIHRYSDMHGCTFDYKADGAERIRKDNPVVVGEKIQKI